MFLEPLITTLHRSDKNKLFIIFPLDLWTGTGKTAAFMLPVLERLLYKPKEAPVTRVLVLTPTRELAVQIHQVSRQLAQYSNVEISLSAGTQCSFLLFISKLHVPFLKFACSPINICLWALRVLLEHYVENSQYIR